MITLTEEEIAKRLKPADVLSAVKRAHIDLTLGKAENAIRHRVRAPGFSLHTLSAASKELGLAAAKVYSATKTGVVSTLLIYSTKDGRLLASLPANELGRKRTAATAVLGLVELLSNPSGEIALIGTGFQAWGLVEALTHLALPSLSLRVFGRDSDRRQKFCDAVKKQFEVNVSAFGSANEAAVGADAIFVATTSSAPVVEDSAMTNLRYVCALGANALSRRELAPRSVTRACQIIVDSREVARIEGGTLLPVVENGRVGWQEIVEIGEIVAGNREKITPAPGRYSLFCSHGLAVQDLYTASLLM